MTDLDDILDGPSPTRAGGPRRAESEARRPDVGLLLPRPFPVEALPGSLRALVTANAKAIGCDASMVALPALTAAAACVGTTRTIRLKPGYTEPAILWTVVVAASGTGKSPALEAAVEPLQWRQTEWLEEHARALEAHKRAEAQHRRDASAWQRNGDGGAPPDEPEAPKARRLIVSDVTIEAMAPLLRDNPRGLLVSRDELGAWFRGFDAYRKGRGGDAQNWMELWKAGALTVDRKGAEGPIHAPRAAVSVCGTIQPGVFARVMHDGRGEHAESGLLARLLIARPPVGRVEWTEASVPSGVAIEYGRTLGRLLSLQHEGDRQDEPLVLPLDAEAGEAWRAWFAVHAQRIERADDDAARASLVKIGAYAARLSLLHALYTEAEADGPGAGPVGAGSVRAGCLLADWFADEALRALACFTEPEDARRIRRLVEWIVGRGGATTPREVNHHLRAYPTADAAFEALDRLVALKLGRWTFAPPGLKGGAPSRRFELCAGAAITPAENAAKAGSGGGGAESIDD